MAIYMSVTGASVAIQGDVTEASHAKWVKIDDFSFEIEREVRSVTGRAADRNTEVPKISAVKCKKQVDMSSFAMFQNALFGAAATQVQFDFTRQLDDGTTITWQTYTLYEVILSKYDVSASGEEHPSENFEMSHTKFTQTYTAYGSDGKTKIAGPSTAGFDQKTGKKV
jgi:type VI secretion system Hcp family effector